MRTEVGDVQHHVSPLDRMYVGGERLTTLLMCEAWIRYKRRNVEL